jgi:hypothetical protein
MSETYDLYDLEDQYLCTLDLDDLDEERPGRVILWHKRRFVQHAKRRHEYGEIEGDDPDARL